LLKDLRVSLKETWKLLRNSLVFKGDQRPPFFLLTEKKEKDFYKMVWQSVLLINMVPLPL
jgi:hypothetical protein